MLVARYAQKKMKVKTMKTLLDKPILFRDPDYKQKILLFDIENTPMITYTWGMWEQDVIEVKEDWYILCFAYMWLGEKQPKVVALPDFRGYKKDRTNDLHVVKKLWELFEQAEVVIAHNGDQFDIKKANVRFLKHGLEPPSFYKTIDTLKLARRIFKFDSNKLDYLGQYLKVGRKVPHTGKHLWLGCMAGNPEDWNIMKRYNKQDLILLEKVYRKLRGWDNSQVVNLNLVYGTTFNCPKCGSPDTHKDGARLRLGGLIQRYHCKNCGRWSSQPVSKEKERPLR
jgi:predicted RNA-binding Zn-ribbon protein involved in translation (DUF1610 family)